MFSNIGLIFMLRSVHVGNDNDLDVQHKVYPIGRLTTYARRQKTYNEVV